MSKKIAGVIPARWASTRLPGKPLAMIAGKPMIQRVVERVVQAETLSAVIVATDDQRIVDAVASFGIPGVKAVMTRADHPSGTDRIAEAVAGEDCEVVINIQGDEPLMDPVLIDRLGQVMLSGNWDMATAATRIKTEADLNNPAVRLKITDGQGQHGKSAFLSFHNADSHYYHSKITERHNEPGQYHPQRKIPAGMLDLFSDAAK